ncbi:hypothetical protein CONPUDRAFT_31214, partial [Coniophora puteana RWD-64-598 SS2]
RLDDVSALDHIKNLQLTMGLFHKQLNLAWQNMDVHKHSVDTPGSFAWTISILGLKRLHREKPDYQTMVQLLFNTVLQANVLVYWEIITGKLLWDLAKDKPSASTLLETAQKIHSQFFCP